MMGAAQWVNPGGIALAARVALSRRARPLVVPHVRAASVAELDFAALRRAGVSAVVFDKDNTLTHPYSDALAPGVCDAVKDAVEAFGHGRVVVFSNHAGSGDDHGHAAAQRLEASLGLAVLRHDERKPGGARALAALLCGGGSGGSGGSGDGLGKVAVVGDRLLTDVALANANGMLSVHTRPLTVRGENAAVRAARWFEDAVLDGWLCRGVSPPRHPCLDALETDLTGGAHPQRDQGSVDTSKTRPPS